MPPFQAHNTLMCFRSQVLYFCTIFRPQAFTNRLRAVFSLSPTSYSVSERTRQFLLTKSSKSLEIDLSYRNAQVNTQEP